MLSSWSLMSVMGQDNVALESGQYPRYAPHSSCHTEYDHVSVVKQGRSLNTKIDRYLPSDLSNADKFQFLPSPNTAPQWMRPNARPSSRTVSPLPWRPSALQHLTPTVTARSTQRTNKTARQLLMWSAGLST